MNLGEHDKCLEYYKESFDMRKKIYVNQKDHPVLESSAKKITEVLNREIELAYNFNKFKRRHN